MKEQEQDTTEDSIVNRICDRLGVRDLLVRENLQKLVSDILTEEINKYKADVKETLYGSKSYIGIDAIINYVCERYLITNDELQTKTRKTNIREPRQIIHWMIRNQVSRNRMSLEAVGKLVGSQDHSTVLHSVKVVNNMIETDSVFRERLMMMCNELGARTVWMSSDGELKVTGYLKKHVSDSTITN